MSYLSEANTIGEDMVHAPRILVVDDSEVNRALLERRMSSLGYQVESAESGPDALARLNGPGQFDLVLLDIVMPGMSGLGVLKEIRENFSAMRLPVIMVSALDESSSIAEALNMGANDYITKPVDVIVARARIQTHLRLKAAEEAVHRMDAMSGLGNRLFFNERLEAAFARCRSGELDVFTVVVFGLDRYYMITESLGPDASDELARQIADRLKRNVRQSDTVARLGENEFALLIEAGPDSRAVFAVNDFLKNGLQAPFHILDTEITGSASAGVACYAADYERAEHVLRDAGIARNRAKDLGGARLVVFQDRMGADSTRLLQMEVELRRGLQRNELHVFLSAHYLRRQRPRLRPGSAGSLDSSRTRPDRSRGVHSPGGGDRFNRAARRVRFAGGLPAVDPLGAHAPGVSLRGGQRVGSPVREPGVDRQDQEDHQRALDGRAPTQDGNHREHRHGRCRSQHAHPALF